VIIFAKQALAKTQKLQMPN